MTKIRKKLFFNTPTPTPLPEGDIWYFFSDYLKFTINDYFKLMIAKNNKSNERNPDRLFKKT
jgi:hypothetical protein